uniref:Uncharacterized protein n=1 Tax=Ditylenchus dipsaci TaxID=166011 RepID=A0A915EAS2_9BILA
MDQVLNPSGGHPSLRPFIVLSQEKSRRIKFSNPSGGHSSLCLFRNVSKELPNNRGAKPEWWPFMLLEHS